MPRTLHAAVGPPRTPGLHKQVPAQRTEGGAARHASVNDGPRPRRASARERRPEPDRRHAAGPAARPRRVDRQPSPARRAMPSTASSRRSAAVTAATRPAEPLAIARRQRGLALDVEQRLQPLERLVAEALDAAQVDDALEAAVLGAPRDDALGLRGPDGGQELQLVQAG